MTKRIIEAQNFGLSGQIPEVYDNLFRGKRGRKRARARKKNRMNKRRWKAESIKISNDEKKLKNEIMKKMMLGGEAKKTSSKTANAKNAIPDVNLPPQPQQAGFGSNKIMMVLGALLIAGMIFKGRKHMSPTARPVAPLPPVQ